MDFSKIIIDGESSSALRALKEHINTLDKTLSYAKMMEYRTNGMAKDECIDTYYIAYENEKMLSRLWNGWGRHENAIGNFGNFLTLEEARGKGVGGKLLKMWIDDISARQDSPLGLFCSAGSVELVNLYAKYGFSLAVKNTITGPLYKPLNDSPLTFSEFCEKYYTPSDKLYVRKASVEYRHEIDCLLKFALLNNDVEFGFEEAKSIEEILMFKKYGANILFTKDNKVAGWQILLSDGCVKTQVYPLYNDSEIIH